MKQIIYLLLFTILTTSCNKIEGEGAIITKDYEINSSFSTISVGSALRLELSDDVAIGKLKIETYSNIFDYINLNEEDDKIEILMDNERYESGLDITIYASSAQYNLIEARGASSVILLSEIQSPEYNLRLSGASKATIAGSTTKCNVTASGSSSINGKKFLCQDLTVQLSGASELTIGIDKTAKGKLTGASKLYYLGDPEIDIETSGSSKIKAL